ncbi:MAG: UvrB/UvrC motif-containing protein [Clostridiales bacterium]|nr:UvrB/UvrC motif-containing protein [Clostridiales bacterium]MBR6254959.1 UvrB/UvrC motif-containing protein [Clostridiales bacterium]
MKCQRCKEREANVKIMKQTSGKAPQMLMLCDECARALGISMPGSLVGGSLFGGALGSAMSNPLDILASAFEAPFGLGLEDAMSTGAGMTKTCPTCGLSLGEFMKSGFLGCPDCYSAFSERIDPVFMRTQMGMKHVGRLPGKDGENVAFSDIPGKTEIHEVETDSDVLMEDLPEEEKEKKMQILKKEKLLKKAVAEEDYLTAAKLRDEISALKGQKKEGDA